jgi:hypothetical protein
MFPPSGPPNKGEAGGKPNAPPPPKKKILVRPERKKGGLRQKQKYCNPRVYNIILRCGLRINVIAIELCSIMPYNIIRYCTGGCGLGLRLRCESVPVYLNGTLPLRYYCSIIPYPCPCYCIIIPLYYSGAKTSAVNDQVL